LSVTDKTGLVDFGRFLSQGGVELVSTGGTRRKLLDAGLDVRSVSELTGFPEIMDGRVKTLHPHIHGAILADKDNPEHLRTLSNLGIAPIDLVCVNLYEFAEASGRDMDAKSVVEYIDIGGPTMLRAAAKNFHSILVVPTTEAYPRVQNELVREDFHVGLELRYDMACRTFDMTSRYDRMISDYLSSKEV
jgi:phosphoribosylaminoimidazolecarboxamide formyltransferase/IMP cyclohydrolase